MTRTTPTTVLLAFSLVVAGCTGASSDAGPMGFEPDAPRDPEKAHLEGRVVDEELRGINASLTLVGLERTTNTTEDGAFAFVNVEPGDHDLLVYALGFEASGQRLDLLAGETKHLTITLRPLPGNETFHETFPYTGHEPCQWYVGGSLSHCTLPYTAVHGFAKQNGVNLSQYGVPPDLQNNKAMFNFSVRPNNTGVVSELFWRAGSAAATIQALIIMCPWYDPVLDECLVPGTVNTGKRYFFVKGTSPIRLQWNHPMPKHLDMAPFVWSRANVNGDSSHPVGVAFEQKVDFYNTVFYGAPPPEGFSAGPIDG